jgi:hypothetical protein
MLVLLRLWNAPVPLARWREYPNRNIKPGTLDDSSWLIPTTHFWTRSAQKWVVIPEGATRYETQPETLAWTSPKS